MRKWEYENNDKKKFFVFLFFYLFIFGTMQLYYSESQLFMFMLQVCLLVFLFNGYIIYKKLTKIEKLFEDNINEIYSHIKGN